MSAVIDFYREHFCRVYLIELYFASRPRAYSYQFLGAGNEMNCAILDFGRPPITIRPSNRYCLAAHFTFSSLTFCRAW